MAKKGKNFAADKVIAASLAGAAFGAMVIAIARQGAEAGTTPSAADTVTAAPALPSIVGSGTAPGSTADATQAPAAVPTPTGQQRSVAPTTQTAPVPRARRSRAS